MTDNIFEKATRLNVTFQYKGLINVIDLWDLSLETLDSIYSSLVKANKESEGGSLLNTRKNEDKINDLKIELVKYVFEVKQAEALERKNATAKRQQKEKLKEVLERKQNAELESLSTEQIEKMIEDM